MGVILIGNLGKDPEIRYSTFGLKIVNLSIATSERWKDKNTKENKEKTEWHKIVVFNEHIADLCEKYLKSGSKIYIEGSLQNRKWTDQSGIDRFSTEIVIPRFKGDIIILGENKNTKEILDNKNHTQETETNLKHPTPTKSTNSNVGDIEKEFLNQNIPN